MLLLLLLVVVVVVCGILRSSHASDSRNGLGLVGNWQGGFIARERTGIT